MPRPFHLLGLLALLVASRALSPSQQTCASFGDCTYPQLCFSGVCREAASSDRCDGVNTCPAPLQCRYVGSSSLRNICIATRAAGESCGSSQCEDGYSCTSPSDIDSIAGNRICVRRRLNIGDECSESLGLEQKCGSGSQCLSRPGGGSPVCTSGLQTGAVCDSAQPFNACSFGFICKGNMCIQQVLEGQACDDDSGPYCRGPPTAFSPALYCDRLDGRKRCVRRQRIGQVCSAELNLSCQPGDECIDGFCGNRAGVLGSLCGGGGAGYPGTFQGNLVCDLVTQRCSKKVGLGESCSASARPGSGFPFTSFQVCQEGACIDNRCRREGVGLGDQCDTDFPNTARCPEGLSCMKADGRRGGSAFNGDDVCVDLFDLGGSCSVPDFKPCNGEPGSRAACENGRCVASSVGQFGDKCVDKAEGGPTGVTCYGGDDCGEGKLTCMDRGGGGLDPRIGDNLFCGLADQQLGEDCETGTKGLKVLARCAGGANCYTNVLSAGGKCLLLVDEGQHCNFDEFVRCKFGYACARDLNVCVAEP